MQFLIIFTGVESDYYFAIIHLTLLHICTTNEFYHGEVLEGHPTLVLGCMIFTWHSLP